MSTRKLHEDWPEYELGAASYDIKAPICDLIDALEAAPHLTTGVPSERVDSITIGQIDEVVRYAVSYHSSEWKPGDGGGTELDLAVVARLHDGRWVSVEGWNDYTGWGCQDGAYVRVSATEDDVVWHGLSAEARRRLGYDASAHAEGAAT